MADDSTGDDEIYEDYEHQVIETGDSVKVKQVLDEKTVEVVSKNNYLNL